MLTLRLTVAASATSLVLRRDQQGVHGRGGLAALGPSLDALDDMLRGGYGALHDTEEARVIWAEHASAEALGVEVTRAQLLAKLEDPRFDQAIARRKLDRLEAEGGPTYSTRCSRCSRTIPGSNSSSPDLCGLRISASPGASVGPGGCDGLGALPLAMSSSRTRTPSLAGGAG